MRIRFGMHLDGLDPTPPRTAIGEATVGPLGLLGILETDLGLPPVLEHPAEQLITYRGILDELDTPERFYHRSFAVDPINVARTLMDWRAQWFEAGWAGSFPHSVSRRLADMADIEALAFERLPPCVGQRAQRALADLAQRRTQIKEIVLLEDPDALPAVWRALVERIGFEVAAGVTPSIHAAPNTDLHHVQSEFLEALTRAEGKQQTKIQLAGDDSFIVIRSASRDISARAVAEMCRERNEPMESVVVAETDGIIVDNALERSGLARCGFQHYSRFRAVTQVLQLTLALLWEPLNPHLLLQFLIHPLGPLSPRIRRTLAEAVSSEPGVGGQAWRQALAAIETNERESNNATDTDIERLLNEIRYWCSSPRFAGDAAPIEALTERAQRCANWLNGRLAREENAGVRSALGSAVAQANALIASLSNLNGQGQAKIAKVELDRLLDEVRGNQPDPESFAEAGHMRAATSSGAITESWPQVIWWDLAARHLEINHPWSSAELTELRANGVDLPTIATLLRQRGDRWLRPILNCSEQLVLAVHDSETGYHPLWTQLQNSFTGWLEVRVDTALLEGQAEELEKLNIVSDPVPVKALPSPRRWWELPEEAHIPAREVESFSSLNKLYHHPHEWVLNYAAKLRPGRAVNVANDNLLYGSLAHRLFEEFFVQHEDWRKLDANAVTQWLKETVPALMAQEGAVLLEPGRGVDRQRVAATLETSLHRLLGHLTSANIVSVTAEHHEEQPYLDTSIRGDLDLLLTDKDGREIVVDAKWGSERYRGEELEANNHLQLATYAYMRKTGTGANRWPYPAYYIVTTGNMLAPDDHVFPNAVVHAPSANEGLTDLWDRAEATYHWRKSQLVDRHIEVNAKDTEPTPRSDPPQQALFTNTTDPDRFDDYTGLTGWDTFS